MKTLAIMLEYNYCCYVIVAVSAVIWIKKLRFANLKMQVVHIQQRVVHIIETIHGNKTKQTIIKKKLCALMLSVDALTKAVSMMCVATPRVLTQLKSS